MRDIVLKCESGLVTGAPGCWSSTLWYYGVWLSEAHFAEMLDDSVRVLPASCHSDTGTPPLTVIPFIHLMVPIVLYPGLLCVFVSFLLPALLCSSSAHHTGHGSCALKLNLFNRANLADGVFTLRTLLCAQGRCHDGAGSGPSVPLKVLLEKEYIYFKQRSLVYLDTYW